MSNTKDFIIEGCKLKKYTGKDKEVFIPDGVSQIDWSAFENCTNLKKITIPDSVTSISSCAFKGCTNLTDINIPDSVYFFNSDAFCGCRGLMDDNGFIIVKGVFVDYLGENPDVIVPEGVKEIGHSAFLSSLENRRTNTNKCNLRSISIPDSVTKFDGSTFSGCEDLISINIPNSITEIPYNCFNGCKNLVNITLPDSIETIAEHAFENCKNLKNITIPESVKKIRQGAFYGCESLKDENGFVVVNGILFDYCGDDSDIIIPDGVKIIDDYSLIFRGCYNIKSINMADSVISIGKNAFSSCINLSKINFSNSIKKIDEYAFDGCESLTDIYFPDSLDYIGELAFNECNNLKIRMSSNITHIDLTAFKSCNHVEFELPDSLTMRNDNLPAVIAKHNFKASIKGYAALRANQINATWQKCLDARNSENPAEEFSCLYEILSNQIPLKIKNEKNVASFIRKYYKQLPVDDVRKVLALYQDKKCKEINELFSYNELVEYLNNE